MAKKRSPQVSLHMSTDKISNLSSKISRISFVDYYYQTPSKFYYEFWPKNENQEGIHNVHHLLVCTFINFLDKFKYVLFLSNVLNTDDHQNDHPHVQSH